MLIRTLQGGWFYGGSRQGPTTAQISHIQLFNPAASGIIVAISKIKARTGGSVEILLSTHNAALTTLVSQGINRQVSAGANALAAIRFVDSAAVGSIRERFLPGSGNLVSFDFEDAELVLEAGWGAIISAGSVNTDISASFRWREVSA